jgi:hypothetical protein
MGRSAVPIDFTLTPEQLRLRWDARAFAGDVLSKVESATRDLPTPLARFAATRPFASGGTLDHAAVRGPSRASRIRVNVTVMAPPMRASSRKRGERERWMG